MTDARRILIADGDELLRDSLRGQLEDGFAVDEAATATEALAAAERAAYDVILVDAALPETGGREVRRRLRGRGVRCPVITLGDDSPAAGPEAHDRIRKPFRIAALLARIDAGPGDAGGEILEVGSRSFSPAAGTLTDGDGKIVRLTEKEAEILEYLLLAGGKAVGRAELLNQVWGYDPEIATHTLETHIYRLRQKIEADPAEPRLLRTGPRGYRLVARPDPERGGTA